MNKKPKSYRESRRGSVDKFDKREVVALFLTKNQWRGLEKLLDYELGKLDRNFYGDKKAPGNQNRIDNLIAIRDEVKEQMVRFGLREK